MFAKAEFITSAATNSQYPSVVDEGGNPLPELAVVGRSNVGKSSLINHLTQNKKLARVSSTPGKTQLINFFNLDEELILVDLPGYGFAKVPKTIRDDWSALIQNYLENRNELKLILLLCDARHPPTKDDLLFVQWAKHYQKPLILLFTKTDKLNKNALASSCAKNSACFSD